MFPLPLVLTVVPSGRARRGLAGLHLLAAVALWLADLPPAAQAAGTLLLGPNLLRQLRSPPAMTLRCGRRGELARRQGETWQPVPEFEAPLVLPALTLLRFRSAPRRRPQTLLILTDSLPEDDFRRLRVWLKWLGTGPRQAAEQPAKTGVTPLDTGPPGTR